jgi:tetratricopeptide (TPR) repeat protein
MTDVVPEATGMYDHAMCYYLEKNYLTCYDKLKELIYLHRKSDEAFTSFTFLPYLAMLITDKFEDLIMFLDEIYSLAEANDEKDVMSKINFGKALIETYKYDYQGAIAIYMQILESQITDLEKLIIQLEIAYLHFMLVMSGGPTRGLPANLAYTPNSLDEYLAIEKEILIRINELQNARPEDEKLPEINEFRVSNYPNPFNPETVISFQLPGDSMVSIDIYNIKGQKVRTLVKDSFNSGSHKVTWNGVDDNNRNAGSGVYFYRIQAGKYNEVKKMILLK